MKKILILLLLVSDFAYSQTQVATLTAGRVPVTFGTAALTDYLDLVFDPTVKRLYSNSIKFGNGTAVTPPSLFVYTSLATTAASGNGTTATITYASQASAPFVVGSTVTIAGVTPSGYNGNYVVTACTTTTVSYLSATTGSQTVAGTASGSLLTTIAAGSVEYNGTHYKTTSSLNRIGDGGPIKDFFVDAGNTGSSETDMFTYTTKAGTLAVDGDQLTFTVTGNIVGSATASRTINVYFAGTVIGTVSAATISTTGSFKAVTEVIRTSSTTARCSVTITVDNLTLATPVTQTDLTSLTLSGTNIIKITGTSSGTGSATNDIVSKSGKVFWWPASNN